MKKVLIISLVLVGLLLISAFVVASSIGDLYKEILTGEGAPGSFSFSVASRTLGQTGEGAPGSFTYFQKIEPEVKEIVSNEIEKRNE